MNVARFTFNDFQENTYVLYDESKSCIIVDPGCNSSSEQKVLVDFIESNNLKPVHLVNTHCHIDHILGNAFIASKYKLKLTSHKGEQTELSAGPMVSNMYGISYDPSPDIEIFLDEGDTLSFGNISLDIYFTPGHSSSSIVFHHKDSKQLIAGDVLFQGSIGRTDLPGGNFETLINSIKSKLLVLDDNTIVYPGHGDKTTIGVEKNSNPYLSK